MRAYQNRGKSILEIFCKDYDVCLLAVMERQLSVIRSLMVLLLNILSFVFCKMEKKVYDSRFTWPYALLCCGPTGSGKTSFVLGLLKNHEILSTHTPHKLIWIYGVSQPELFREIRGI